VSEALAALPRLATAHLQLSLAGLGFALALALPLGVAAARRPRLAAAALGAASVIQTIPSLALLAIMVPLLAAIGFVPAWLALTLYAALPILRNTVAGIAGVPAELVEAARGVGMTASQQLRRVELPLALPVIVAGVRTAAVWTVGTATLSTPVGAPSLGNLIFAGLQTRNEALVVTGCAAAAALALGLDQAIGLLERGVRERRPARVRAAALLLAAAAAWAGGAFAWRALEPAAEPVRVGAKPFTEQYVLAELLTAAIERETGRPAVTLQNLGSTVLFDALAGGQLDAYVDYSGTLWATVLGRSGAPPGREEVLADVKAALEAQHGVRVVAALGFENTYALAMTRERAQALGVRTIGDLAEHAPALEIGGDYEWFERAEWRALAAAYGLAFRGTRAMDPTLMYAAVAQGDVDVIAAYSTDGRIAAYELAVLEDERGALPPYDAVVLVSRSLAERAPDAVAALTRLAGAVDDAAMRRLNLAVDRDGRSPRQVARAFLAQRGR
jgi:osmoprotectant transport system permease protein